MRQKGARAARRLKTAIQRLKLDPRFAKQPGRFGQSDMDWIVRERFLPKPVLDAFWAALIFNRDHYTCQYCRRTVTGVWRESGKRRSIGLVVEHRRPRSRRGRSYTFTNSATSCWTCNGIKSTLSKSALHDELESLARAVLAWARRSPRNGPRVSRQ
jgi:hypothetical protein